MTNKLTPEEEAAAEAAMAEIAQRLRAGLCPEGCQPQYAYQVHQSMYAHPCNHRLGVGNARKHNERYGRTAPESAHVDPEYGLYSDWVD